MLENGFARDLIVSEEELSEVVVYEEIPLLFC